jgi:hypothetical protein
MLKLLSETIDEVLAGDVVGIMLISVDPQGGQLETAVSDETDFSLSGRLTVANSRLVNAIAFDPDEEYED